MPTSFVRRLGNSLKRMAKMLSYHQQDGNRGELTSCSPRSLSSVTPSPFFDSYRWAALHGNMTLIVGFAQIGEDPILEEGDIVIKLLELGRKNIRLELIARLVIKWGQRRGRPIGGAGRECETK